MSDYDEGQVHQIADVVYHATRAQANDIWARVVETKEFIEYTALNNALDNMKLDNFNDAGFGQMREFYRESARLRAKCAHRVIAIVREMELDG